MSNKTISINPSLFSIGKSKTKKNREKKEKTTTVPIISPNVLKNKLLKRIKEHKQKETQNLDTNRRKLIPKIEPETHKKGGEQADFSDEFNDSINYLQTLSKQRELDENKRRQEISRQKQREELERRTVRNYHSINSSPDLNVNISLDLPMELQQPVIQPIPTETMRINRPDDVPYGILKGGTKPSYREWNKTQRNAIVTNPNASLIIEGGMQKSQQTARENRLNRLKEKIKMKQVGSEVSQTDAMSAIKIITPVASQQLQSQNQNQSSIEQSNNGDIIATKHVTKKTIKRKYTLGKSISKNRVAILIKDRNTRKRILTAQKDLKKKNINDIKIYLRDHNLIKAGSNAPNDVLRKLYESAMLSGEITNSNYDTLLHNISKEDKEL